MRVDRQTVMAEIPVTDEMLEDMPPQLREFLLSELVGSIIAQAKRYSRSTPFRGRLIKMGPLSYRMDGNHNDYFIRGQQALVGRADAIYTHHRRARWTARRA